jgi:hypothetical protein
MRWPEKYSVQIHPVAFPWPPVHRQFATAEPVRPTLPGAMPYGSNRLRTRRTAELLLP